MVGARVVHGKYGQGIITKEEDGKVYIDFPIGEKIFPYRTIEKFVTFDDLAVQEEIHEKACAQIAEREKAEADHKEAIRIAAEESKVVKTSKSATKAKEYDYWIKFEGPQNERQAHEMVSVKEGDRTLYILNYVKKPSGVNDGATVYMAAGIQDDEGVAQQSIIGRGTLCRFKDKNVVKPEWIEKYPWMNHYQYYLVLKEFECIDSARKDGLLLNQVLEAVGADTYPSSEGQDVTMEKLRSKHTQKMHMMITDVASSYIDEKLEKLFEKYGSHKYVSEL